MSGQELPNRIIGIDPGDKRIGVAISNEGASLARPLEVIQHISRQVDAERIIVLATENQAKKIIMGTALGMEGEETPASRKAGRLAAEIQNQSELEVILWDESGSTRRAKETIIHTGVPRKQRRGHQDAAAAAIILQDYLDSLYLVNETWESEA
jgi:putative Holliday junction resolvase